MKIPVIFSADHNFIMPTGVAIKSLVANSATEVYEINILVATDVTEDDKNRIIELTKNSKSTLNFIPIGKVFDNAYEIRGISKATYFRLLIPWLFPDYNKVVYCDGDVIFRNGLSQLYNEDITDFYVGGIKDYFWTRKFKKHIASIGLSWDNYINAGILLINCDKQRKDNLNLIYEKHTNLKYQYQDQDIINIVCNGHIKYLPIKYNFNPVALRDLVGNSSTFNHRYMMQDKSPIKDIDIVHYCGSKPWKLETGFLMGDWWYFFSKTPWYDPMLEYKFNNSILYPNLTLKNVLRIIKHHLTNKFKIY